MWRLRWWKRRPTITATPITKWRWKGIGGGIDGGCAGGGSNTKTYYPPYADGGRTHNRRQQ
eukprot:5319185-Pyramimonas_sp.AAC.1